MAATCATARPASSTPELVHSPGSGKHGCEQRTAVGRHQQLLSESYGLDSSSRSASTWSMPSRSPRDLRLQRGDHVPDPALPRLSSPRRAAAGTFPSASRRLEYLRFIFPLPVCVLDDRHKAIGREAPTRLSRRVNLQARRSRTRLRLITRVLTSCALDGPGHSPPFSTPCRDVAANVSAGRGRARRHRAPTKRRSRITCPGGQIPASSS